MDPLGFALENFDADRQVEEIVIAFAGTMSIPPVVTRRHAAQRSRRSAARRCSAVPEQFVQTFTERLLMYATGRSWSTTTCPPSAGLADAAHDDYKFQR